MAGTIRTFIAVDVPVSADLAAAAAELGTMGSAVKPVAPENRHVTLRFLGDTTAAQLELVVELLGSLSTRYQPFEVAVRGLGAFPHAQRPSVVWAGVIDDGQLASIAAELESPLLDLGFERDRLDFKPHLTLARVRRKPPPSLGELLSRYEATEFGTANIESLKLYRSELTPGGAVYTVAASQELHRV